MCRPDTESVTATAGQNVQITGAMDGRGRVGYGRARGSSRDVAPTQAAPAAGAEVLVPSSDGGHDHHYGTTEVRKSRPHGGAHHEASFDL
jgi:hypothetical protein